MKTLNRTNLVLAGFGFLAFAFFAAELIETKGLPIIGLVVAYITTVAIIAVAGNDNTRTKKLI